MHALATNRLVLVPVAAQAATATATATAAARRAIRRAHGVSDHRGQRVAPPRPGSGVERVSGAEAAGVVPTLAEMATMAVEGVWLR